MKTENLLQLFKNTKSSPTDVQSYLLSLLNKFELALTWDNRTLLIPSLLPTEDQLRFGHVGCDISVSFGFFVVVSNRIEPIDMIVMTQMMVGTIVFVEL